LVPKWATDLGDARCFQALRTYVRYWGERPLGIPTIRDRVIQAAAKIVIEPIFAADFEDNAYGYRSARGVVDAVKEVHRYLCRGYADVVDADLSKYFDTIPHSELIKLVARRVVDRNVLRLIKMWLLIGVPTPIGTLSC
jgi:RNA-directed DNA polymerase